jgi:hypothetical protein
MANIVATSYYKVRTFCYSLNQMSVNVRYFQVATVTGGTMTETQFITALGANFATVMKAAMTNNAEYIGSDVQNITGAKPYPIQVASLSGAGFGAAGANPLPTQVCGVLSLKTALTGRGYRGRSYIPFPDFSAVNTGSQLPTGAYETLVGNIGNVVTGALAVVNGGVTVTVQWMLRHSKPVAIAGTYTPIVGYVTPDAFGTQRRRGSYGRQNPIPVP